MEMGLIFGELFSHGILGRRRLKCCWVFFEFLIFHEVCFIQINQLPLTFTVFVCVCVCVFFLNLSLEILVLSGILSLMICCSGKSGFNG